MIKNFIILFFLFVTTNSFCQNKIIFQLESIIKENYENELQDTSNLIIPAKILITANPLSSIKELTKFNGYSIGVQFEILKSRLQNTEHLVFGMSFYKRKIGLQKWEILLEASYTPLYDSNGILGFKGMQIGSSDFRFSEEGPDYLISYQLQIN